MRLSVALVCAAATFVASIEAAPPGYGPGADLQAGWEEEHGGPAPDYDFEEDNGNMLMARGVKHGHNMPKPAHKHHAARDEDSETYQMRRRDALATGAEDPTDPTEAVPGNLGIPKATDLTQALKDLYDRFIGSDVVDETAKMLRRSTDDSVYHYDDEAELADSTGDEITQAQREAQGPEVDEEIDPALVEAIGLDDSATEDLTRRDLEDDFGRDEDDFDEVMGAFDDNEHEEHEKRGLEHEYGQDFHDEDDEELPGEEDEGDMGEFTDEEHAEHEKRGIEATEEEMEAYGAFDQDIAENEKRGLDATEDEMSAYAEEEADDDGDDEMGGFTAEEDAQVEELARRSLDADLAWAQSDASDEELEGLEEMGVLDDDEHAEHEKRGLEGEHGQDLHDDDEFPGEEDDGEMGDLEDEEHREHERRGLAEEFGNSDDEDDDDDDELPGEEDDGEMGELTDEEHVEHEKRGLEGEHGQDFHDDDDELPGEEDDESEMGEFTAEEHAEHEKRGLNEDFAFAMSDEADEEEADAFAGKPKMAKRGLAEDVAFAMSDAADEEEEDAYASSPKMAKRGLNEDLAFAMSDAADEEEEEVYASSEKMAKRDLDEDLAFAMSDAADEEDEDSLLEEVVTKVVKTIAARGTPSGFT